MEYTDFLRLIEKTKNKVFRYFLGKRCTSLFRRLCLFSYYLSILYFLIFLLYYYMFWQLMKIQKYIVHRNLLIQLHIKYKNLKIQQIKKHACDPGDETHVSNLISLFFSTSASLSQESNLNFTSSFYYIFIIILFF